MLQGKTQHAGQVDQSNSRQKGSEKLEEAKKELEDALVEVELPRPEPAQRAAKIIKRRTSRRRVSE
jgi:tRNA C32,U32 (ribose-2'-O)-methylase TrmJ